MNIRTITVFAHPGWPLHDETIASAGKFVREAKQAFESGGFTVQTTRLATPPFPELLGAEGAGQAIKLAQDVEALCFVHNFEYIGLGPVRPDDPDAFSQALPEMIMSTQNVAATLSVAEPAGGVSLPAVRRAARTVHRIAGQSPDGFANLRFAALANVPPGVPFLPSAYHDGGASAFAVGVEAADLLVNAVEEAQTLAEARANVIRLVEENAKPIAAIARRLGGAKHFRFAGIDFSPAPYPEEARSLGRAIERLGAPKVGWHGSLAAAAFLADALDRAEFPRVGFCGLFLPVLEDAVLAARGAEGALTIGDLLTYSAVCGAGLDTVPLPGDISADELAAVILDVAALALRLNKPLTARLMPVPGKRAGDEMRWDFPYFAPCRILAPRAGRLEGHFAGVESFTLAETKPHAH